MATIIRNQFDRNNTPFYLSHVPFEGTFLDLIDQMISYNIEANVDRTINYNLGTDSEFSFVVKIKNMTTNETLTLEVSSDVLFEDETYTIELSPGEETELPFTLSNSTLNGLASVSELKSTISIIVKNSGSGILITRNTQVTEVAREETPLIFGVE